MSNVKASLEEPKRASNIVASFSQQTVPNQILLATAIVKAEARNGEAHLLRALLDQGSQASFVTESTAQSLGLRKIARRSHISGVGGDKRCPWAAVIT
ncbi:unnamed protein product, partial [Iphiclides podalirius]